MIAGHVVERVDGAFVLRDLSLPPETKLNRAYIKSLFEASGCTDLALRDASLTHGFTYPTDHQPQVVCQPFLRSMFVSKEAFLSVHSEALRMSGADCNWFQFASMPRITNPALDRLSESHEDEYPRQCWRSCVP